MAANRKRGNRLLCLAAASALLSAGLPSAALAYVGPSVGIGMLGAVFGLAIAIVVSIGIVILWPFRRLLRRRRPVPASDASAGPSDSAA